MHIQWILTNVYNLIITTKNKIWNIWFSPKDLPTMLCILPITSSFSPLPVLGNYWSTFSFHNFSFSRISSYEWSHRIYSFLCLNSLTQLQILKRFILLHVISSSLLCISKYYFIVWMYLVYSAIHQLIGCFQFLWI